MVDRGRDAGTARGGDQLGGLLDRFRATGVMMIRGVRLRAAAAAGAVNGGAGFAERAGDAASGAACGAGDQRDAPGQRPLVSGFLVALRSPHTPPQ